MATLIACPSCGAALVPAAAYNTREALRCPSCLRRARVHVFPALERPLPGAEKGPLAMPEEASCFHHPARRAETHCESCGRFLCSLCDVEVRGRHYCGNCIAARKQKGTMEALVTRSQRYDRKAYFYGILSFIPVLGIVFAVASLVCVGVSMRRKSTAPLRFSVAGRLGAVPLTLVGLVGQILYLLLITGRLD